MDETPIGRLVFLLATAAAILGGAALVAVTAVTVISVIGRAFIPLGLGAIAGDVELVQAGILFAVCSFLPWCHLERGHALVAIVTDKFPVRVSALLEALWDMFMLVAAAFIAWRFWSGLVDKFGNHESTFILRIPIWIAYAAGLVGLAIFLIVALYCVVRSANNAVAHEPVKPLSGGGE